MKSALLLPIILLVVTAGCSKSNDVMQAPVDYAKGLAKAKQSAANAADASSLNQVSQAISMFQMDKGRFPKTLDELVQEKYLPKIPDAPAGMKIDYDATTGKAALVNQ